MGWSEQDEEEEQAILMRVNGAVLREREACAAICKSLYVDADGPDYKTGLRCAEMAILMRSNG